MTRCLNTVSGFCDIGNFHVKKQEGQEASIVQFNMEKEDNVLKLNVIHTDNYDPLEYHLSEAQRLMGELISVPMTQALFTKLIEARALYAYYLYEEGFVEEDEEEDEDEEEHEDEEESYVEEIVASSLSCQER